MFVYLEGKVFLIALFSRAIDFLSKELQSNSESLIILPCSLNDLAMSWNSKSITNPYKNVDYCTCDSMFLTYFFRLKYKKKIDRVYGPDLLKAVLNKEQKLVTKPKRKHYFLSPNSETYDKLTKILNESYPKINAELNFLPKDISQEGERKMLQKILKSKASFIWLGIGSPKQVELATYLKKHSRGIKIFCVGAAFDFLTGQKKQAPFLMQRFSLEWLFRLFSEPSRLWRRYLVTIPHYLVFVLWRKIIQKRFK